MLVCESNMGEKLVEERQHSLLGVSIEGSGLAHAALLSRTKPASSRRSGDDADDEKPRPAPSHFSLHMADTCV